MADKKRLYLKILQIELEDLLDDLQLLIDKHQESWDGGKITERVYLENKALYLNEMMGVRDFGSIVSTVDTKSYDSLESLKESLKNIFIEDVKHHDLAEAVVACVNRKLEKVARYVTP